MERRSTPGVGDEQDRSVLGFRGRWIAGNRREGERWFLYGRVSRRM